MIQQKSHLQVRGMLFCTSMRIWCPTCRSFEKDVNEHLGDLPANTHILKANYDTEIALKKKYGVTTQTTFVQLIKWYKITKWSGSNTLAKVLAKIQ